jgi:hypothetical protein
MKGMTYSHVLNFPLEYPFYSARPKHQYKGKQRPNTAQVSKHSQILKTMLE